MDFNGNWDILNMIMKMKEEAEYLEKVEARAKSNFNFVLKELEGGQNVYMADNFSKRLNADRLKKSSCGRYYLKNIGLEKPNWVRLKLDYIKYTNCEDFMEYLNELYCGDYLRGYEAYEEGVAGDLPDGMDFDTFVEEWVALHGIHFRIEEKGIGMFGRRYYAVLYYKRNEALEIKKDIKENHRINVEVTRERQRELFRWGKNYYNSSLSSPFNFIKKLDRGALHYLKCKDYTWGSIEEIKIWRDINGEDFNEKEEADRHYFIEGINQPEEDPHWA